MTKRGRPQGRANTQLLSMRFPAWLHKALTKYAQENGESRTNLIVRIMANFMREHGGTK